MYWSILSTCPEVQMLARAFIWLPAKKDPQLEAEQCWFDIWSCGAPVVSQANKTMKNRRNSKETLKSQS